MAEFANWIIIGWFVLNALLIIGRIGKPTIRTTPATGVAAAIIYAALIALVLAYWGGGCG